MTGTIRLSCRTSEPRADPGKKPCIWINIADCNNLQFVIEIFGNLHYLVASKNFWLLPFANHSGDEEKRRVAAERLGECPQREASGANRATNHAGVIGLSLCNNTATYCKLRKNHSMRTTSGRSFRSKQGRQTTRKLRLPKQLWFGGEKCFFPFCSAFNN